jgi:hypothetical protein
MIAWAYHEFLTWLGEIFRGYTMLLSFALVMMTIWAVGAGVAWLWGHRPGRRRRHRGL